ncbi:kinase-like domain-containing protein [Rhizophagus clarus]|uniref:Kinase-like domain-containing protein n=1 Tax=Rhizophagus clarus TaxID=94130 RepID=A0A8H3R2K4_9GLOM|nr:kinase-like domain-containing protein [Rhizophagus clarus]
MSTSNRIDTEIKNKKISVFNYDEFSNMTKAGEGAFGIVYKADWKTGGIPVALKKCSNFSTKELNTLIKVSFHSNINRFLGITKESSNKYVLVLQYANQGNLREYLKQNQNFKSLQWKDKIQMALDITCGLKFLHSRNIIHRDLHAKNILVHNRTLMIADFGLSKQLTAESSSSSTVYGMPAYIDPQCFKRIKYKRNKKSDIYSLGVLLWEITSGYSPFLTIPHCIVVCKIANGFREEPTINTPLKYVSLYQRCWHDDPKFRPSVDLVFNTLDQIANELSLNTNFNSTSLPYVVFNNEKNILIKICQAYLKYTNIGKGFGVEKNKNQAFEWYMKASKAHNLYGYYQVGYCYYYGYGVEENNEYAFKFLQSAIDCNIGLHYLAACYKFGYGIEANSSKSFELYKQSAEEGFVPSQYEVATCCRSGTGTKENKTEALKWYKLYQESGGEYNVSSHIKELSKEITLPMKKRKITSTFTARKREETGKKDLN